MKTFGWHPQSSCYSAKDLKQPEIQQTANCQSPTWWYLLMAVSLIGGLMVGKRGKA